MGSSPTTPLCAEHLVQTRLAQWLQYAPEPICVLEGPTLTYALVNPAYQRLFPGRTLLNLPLLEAVPEFANTPIPSILKQAYSTAETTEHYELPVPLACYPNKQLENRYFNFTCQARRNEHDQLDGVMVFAHEVTEHVRTRERLQALNQQLEAEVAQRTQELEQQRAFLRLVVDALPNLVYIVQDDGQMVFTNAPFERIVSCYYRQIPAPTPGQVPEQVQQLREWRQQVIASQQPLTVALPTPLASGETHHLQVHMRPFCCGQERPQVLVVCTDVTALKQAQQQAEENARVQENFLARMSHEIRTPLNGVLGLTALLEKTPLSASQQAYVHTMKSAGQHLLALVNDVLDLTKLSSTPAQLEHAPIDVEQVLRGAAQTLAAVAEEQGLVLQVTWPDQGALHVLSDGSRLRQVLLNLLSNALKFTQQGHVQLGATLLRDTPTEASVRFWVQDSGIGIAPGEQEHIFEAFAQASAATSQHYGGTGLGLAISAQLVEQLGGVLRVCSAPEQGSTFSFVLSLARVTGVSEPSPAACCAHEPLQGLRVLLAEDNMVNQWIATVMLEQWGVQVYAVSSGTEALAQLQAQHYDVALLDIQMPGLSGVEVTQAVRQLTDATRAAVPIVAMTANAFHADQQRYLAAGMNACLSKPFEEEALARLLSQLTRR